MSISTWSAYGLFNGGTPVVPPASGPILAQRSVNFGSRNGLLSQLRRLRMPGMNWYFGSTAGPLQPGIIAMAVQLDRGAIYANTTFTDGTKFTISQVIFAASTGALSAPIWVGYYGSEHATTAYRNRFRCTLTQDVNSVDMVSAEYLSDQPVMLQIICDGTNFRLDLVLLDGSILPGANGTITGNYVGNSSSAATAIGIGAANNASGTNGNQTFMGCLSNIVVASGTVSETQQKQLARGDNPSTLFGSSLRRWYRLNGPTDLALTAGTDTGTLTLTTANIGSWLPIQTGPSLLGGSDGTSAMSLELMPEGYVAAVAATAPNSARPLPLARVRNLAGASTHFEARAVLDTDSTTGWTPWVQVTSSPVAVGSSATITLPNVLPSDWLVVEVRRVDAPNVRCVGRRCGVGPKIWWDGQSQEDIALMQQTLVTATNDAVRVGVNSRVSFVAQLRRWAAAAPVTHRIAMTDQDGGVGLRAFAAQWTARYPNRCCAIVFNARPGTGRDQWYNNVTTNGTYRSWGDGITAGSGMVTDLLLTAGRDITAFLCRFSTDDFTTTPTFAQHMARYFAGADGVARSWNQPANGLVFPITAIFCEHDRIIDQTRTSTAVQTTALNTFNRRAALRSLLASPPSGVTAILGTTSMDKIMETSGDGAHQAYDDLRGSARQAVSAIPSISAVAGIRAFNAAVRPVSANVSGGNIVIGFSLPNGGSLRTNASAAIGATVRGLEVSTNGGSTWTSVTGTLQAGNTVQIAGSYSPGVQVRYAFGGPINLIVPAEAATVGDAFVAETNQCEELLVVTDNDLSGLSYTAGVPVLATVSSLTT